MSVAGKVGKTPCLAETVAPETGKTGGRTGRTGEAGRQTVGLTHEGVAQVVPSLARLAALSSAVRAVRLTY